MRGKILISNKSQLKLMQSDRRCSVQVLENNNKVLVKDPELRKNLAAISVSELVVLLHSMS